MQSSLPLTGKCHLCGDPTPKRFCCRKHNTIYNAYRWSGKDLAKWTPSKARKLTLAERIDRVVAKAQAGIDTVTPGKDAFYRGTIGVLKAHKM